MELVGWDVLDKDKKCVLDILDKYRISGMLTHSVTSRCFAVLKRPFGTISMK
jgi:hypothetical protein